MSIPFTSGNSFLREGWNRLRPIPLCVNPLHVGELISTRWTLVSSEALTPLCQSPSRRGTHFYMAADYHHYHHCHVSIPFTSGNSFLRRKSMRRIDSLVMCQSPSRRGTHFYHNSADILYTEESVNPLHVGELISTKTFYTPFEQLSNCVNPLHVGELISTRG